MRLILVITIDFNNFVFDFQFVGVEGFITAVTDHFGPEMRRGYRKEIFIGVICFISFLAGLPMVTNVRLNVHQ